MKLYVKVKANAKRERVEALDETHFTVAVSAPPAEGRANSAMLKLLAEHLGVAPSRMMIVQGSTAREKVVELD